MERSATLGYHWVPLRHNALQTELHCSREHGVSMLDHVVDQAYAGQPLHQARCTRLAIQQRLVHDAAAAGDQHVEDTVGPRLSTPRFPTRHEPRVYWHRVV